MQKSYYVYLMTNKNNSVIYTGMTNDLNRRVNEHKNKLISGFTKTYNITKLVHYEEFHSVNEAILREKQIKKWPRKKKIDLINTINGDWKDLAKTPFLRETKAEIATAHALREPRNDSVK